ncbi:hypothetical protein L1987_58332 [Smallanthus sonchifolius]|uniref:Uncharacterized protein n=1 Tax=Smallanthus sonchifolius TaxID=185202 RepID=A0ACB9DEX8_9ASTR|nr:hypothetical protein L1987_58332 [Smallanthus sonchifolius]
MTVSRFSSSERKIHSLHPFSSSPGDENPDPTTTSSCLFALSSSVIPERLRQDDIRRCSDVDGEVEPAHKLQRPSINQQPDN